MSQKRRQQQAGCHKSFKTFEKAGIILPETLDAENVSEFFQMIYWSNRTYNLVKKMNTYGLYKARWENRVRIKVQNVSEGQGDEKF